MKKIVFACMCVVALAACKQKFGQNTYGAGEVGISRAVEFGTIQSVREVNIKGKSSGTGLLLGGGAGAGGGAYAGKGSGKSWATAGGAVAGAALGEAIEQEIQNSNGYDYIILMQSGETKSIVQEKIEGDVVFKRGDKVMLQYCDAGKHQKKCAQSFQRLLPVDSFPPYVKKKRR